MNEDENKNQVNKEIDNAIEFFETQMKTQLHQWTTTPDILCSLYLIKALNRRLEGFEKLLAEGGKSSQTSLSEDQDSQQKD